jgi:hypothetical protein
MNIHVLPRNRFESSNRTAGDVEETTFNFKSGKVWLGVLVGEQPFEKIETRSELQFTKNPL